MSDYQTLQKIIPPDQALSCQAVSRSLGQIKNIFNTALPSLSQVVLNLESNKDLELINALTEPLPYSVANYYANTFATGTGPGNTITVDDVIGVATGNIINTEMPKVYNIVADLTSAGALNALTANGGMFDSVNNGIYTQMQYCLAGDYGNAPTVPATIYFAGGSFGDFDDAFGNGFIPAASNAISNIAAAYPQLASQSNAAYANMAVQLSYNVTNCRRAGLDIGKITNDIANANLEVNSVTAIMSFVGDLHAIGQDIVQGGQSQFVQTISNVSTLSGQAVIASMREGRNIAILEGIGIAVDTQIPSVPQSIIIANNIGSAQYTVTQAQANVVL